MIRASVLAACLTLPACNGLFYHPTHESYRDVSDLPCRCEEARFTSRDGTPLHGWLLRAQGDDAKGIVIHFHGSAQNMTSHVRFVEWLPAEGFNVFTFDYRGYGESGGSAGRQGIHEDCIAAITHVRARTDLDTSKVLVLGQSLGGACALAALGDIDRAGIRGIAVDSTFATYIGVANDAIGGTFITYPIAWLLLTNSHSPRPCIDKLSPIPLLFSHDVNDPVVPMDQGRELFEAAREPKEFVEVPLYGHTVAMMEPEYRARLVQFFERCLAASS